MIEQLLSDFEIECNCHLTLHDLANVFVDADGRSLLGHSRSSHRQRLPVCWNSVRSYCIERCMNQINRRVSRRREVGFIKHCRCGVIELAVPIYRDHIHVATLFAGQWRSRRAETPTELPVAEAEKLQRLCHLLPVFSLGLLETAEHLRCRGQREFNRATEIREFVAFRARQKVTLSDLARKLSLSPSRACHLVKDIFHRPFGTLLAEERIERSRQLLISTDYLVSEVAMLSGFGSAEHFNRMFRRYSDMTPGKYRQLNRLKLE